MKKTCILLMLATLMGASMAQSPACDTISTFPWEADFSGGIGCWEQSGNGYWTAANAQSIYGQLNSGVTSTGYITITLKFGYMTLRWSFHQRRKLLVELPNCSTGVVMVIYPVDVTPLFSCP